MVVIGGIDIVPLPATLGAVVTGVHLGALDDASWRVVEDAFHEHALLLFPGQHLTDDEQRAFAQRFGALEPSLELTRISNLGPDGTLFPAEGVVMRMIRGNEGWHTDSSYMSRAAKASVLSALVVPDGGGHTEWADMRDAYDALDDATKERIATLAAHHSIRWSQSQLGDDTWLPGSYGYDDGDEPLRPLVKHHPVTGRPALFIGRHAHAIPGLDADESERLLAELLADACRPPRVHRHEWAPGDVAVWDNRCVLHRAGEYDYTQPRVVRHTRVAGDDSEVATAFGSPPA
jgi:alpha-ketoglutarate-dependent taurine dioxygenase